MPHKEASIGLTHANPRPGAPVIFDGRRNRSCPSINENNSGWLRSQLPEFRGQGKVKALSLRTEITSRGLAGLHPAEDVRQVALNMRIKVFQSRAQIVEPCLAVRGANKSVLGTFAPAEFQMRTLKARLRQLVPLGKPEIFLPVRIGDGAPVGIADVSDPIFGIDIVITDEHVAIMLDHHVFAAELRSDAAL